MNPLPAYPDDFGPFEGHTWISCSHQGALPKVAQDAALEAMSWKIAPHRLTDQFQQVPLRLRTALGRLINVPTEDVIVANSASYGLHLVANAMPWQSGDEVLLVKGDFPSDILPWLGLEKRGVSVRYIEPRGFLPTPEEFEAALSPATKLFCSTWVHSFSGWKIDLSAIGEICRAKDVVFFINASQGVGAIPLDVSNTPVDAVTSVGFKYLCGPYGTGFLWVRPDIRDRFEYNQAYWLSMMTADALAEDTPVFKTREELGARAYDVFGTGNFMNFNPLVASVEYLLKIGIQNVREYDRFLVDRILDGIDLNQYGIISPTNLEQRTNPVVITHLSGKTAEAYDRLKASNIHGSFRRGNLRLSPHIFNRPEDIDRALYILNNFTGG